MAGFLYFRSGSTASVDAAQLRQWGLGYTMDVGSLVTSRATNNRSPSGCAGVSFGDAARLSGKSFGVDLDSQTWRKMPNREGRPEIWIGFWNDSKPRPNDLVRSQVLRGPAIRMADNQHWQIPIVRRLNELDGSWSSELPAYLDYDENGNIRKGKPLAAYAELWERTAPVADQMLSVDRGIETQEDENAAYAAVVALLAANYVVDLPELVVMGALADDQSIAIAVTASCRYDKLVEWINSIDDDEKKTELQPAMSG